jgi:hypothetical protein
VKAIDIFHRKNIKSKACMLLKSGVVVMCAMCICVPTTQTFAFSRSLDEIYRDMLREEHNGELPEYMINKGIETHDFYDDLADREGGGTHYGSSLGTVDSGKAVSLDRGGYGTDSMSKDWKRIISVVAKGMVSPFDVQEIKQRVDRDDKMAVELLAWMYAVGRGVNQDKKKAWQLYNKGIFLGVPNAERNAKAIYKTLGRRERSQLSMY